MKFLIILCFLLAYTECAQSSRFHIEGFLEEEDDVVLQAESEAEIPGTCFVCKRIMEKVQRTLSDNDSKADIENKLHSVCKKLRLRKICQKLVSKYINKLAGELLTTDDARTACVKIHLCK